MAKVESLYVDIVVWDATDKFRWMWMIGALADKTPFSRGCRSWDEAIVYIDDVVRVTGKKARVQVWGHGNDGRVYINNEHLPLEAMAAVLRGKVVEFWARSCETIRGKLGARWAVDFTNAMQCTYVGHKVVTNWPNPLWQGQIAALRYQQPVYWSRTGNDLRGCWTTVMRPPAHAFRR